MINGKISCRSCDYYLGELSWIRQRQNNYFVPQRQLNPQIEIERYPVPNIYKEIQVNGIDDRLSCRISVCFFPVSGTVRCGNKQCRENLGGVQQYSDRPDLREICALKCKQLKFSFKDENGQNQISIVKKWTDVTFKILEVEPFASNNI
jgi:hypothetical protein